MFEHLDDPAPQAPSARTYRAVLSRAARLRRQRIVSGLAVAGVVTLALGLIIGLAVPRSHSPAQTFAAFDSHVGHLAAGTPVPSANLSDVVFISETRGFGLAFHGATTVLAVTDDAGESWRVVDDALPADLPAQLEFADNLHGYLWGGTPSAQGTVPLWVTADGGRHWVQAPVGPVVSDVSAIGPNVWAVVGTCPISSLPVAAACPSAPTVDVSTDDGVSWQPTTTPPPVTEEPGLSVADQDLELARITTSRAYVLSIAPTRVVGAASSGGLGYTDDGGSSWVTRPDPCPTYFGAGQEIAASGTDDLWMVCASEPSSGSQAKALYRSGDGGQHWTLAAAANAPVLSGNVSLAAGGGLPVDGYVSPDSLGHENLAVLTPEKAWLFPDRSGVFRDNRRRATAGRRWPAWPGPGSSLGGAGTSSSSTPTTGGSAKWGPGCGGRPTACTGRTWAPDADGLTPRFCDPNRARPTSKSRVGTVYCRRVRQATDDEVKRWQEDGWVLLEGLVGTDEIDAALEDLHIVFPTAEQYHADPEGETLRRSGSAAGKDGGLRLARRGSGIPRRPTPLAELLPFPGHRCAQSPRRAPGDRRFRRTGPGDDRPPGVPDRDIGQVHGHHQLRTTHAHRPQPLVVTGRLRGALVARRRLPLPVGRGRQRQSHPPGLGTRLGRSSGRRFP